MFERTRLGGCIYDLADALTRDGAPVDRQVVQAFEPFMGTVVKDMKELNLKPDQACVGMIIGTVNTFYQGGALSKIKEERYDMFLSLVRLYHAACSMMFDNREYFHRASLLYDDDVFRAVDAM